MGTSFSIDAIIKQSWEIIKKHFLIFLGAMILYAIVSTIISFAMNGFSYMGMGMHGYSGDPEDAEALLRQFMVLAPTMIISYLVSMIVSAYFNLCWYNMGLVAAKGEEPTFACFVFTLKKLINAIIASFVVGFVVLIGYLFCIVPGIILSIRFQFFVLNIIEKDMGIVESISESWNQTKGHTMDLFLLGLMYFLINIAGFLCCCVGLLVTIPMTIIGLSVAFLTLRKIKEEGPTDNTVVETPVAPTPTPTVETPVKEATVETPIAEVVVAETLVTEAPEEVSTIETPEEEAPDTKKPTSDEV